MGKVTLEEKRVEMTSEMEEILAEIRRKFSGNPDDLIPMLQAVQRMWGYLPEEMLLEIASLSGVPAAKVFGVATFYAQFRLHPVGQHMIRVCRGTACHVRGSGRILNSVQSRLKVIPGGTTEDRLFSLETVACFGSCALAPVVVANDSVHGRMTAPKVQRILDELKEDKGPLLSNSIKDST